MAAYYNENDPKTAAWLRELIKAGLVADGEVDTRSIVDVSAGDVRGFTQCHWFAGIGGWSYALRLAGWSDDRAVWTGSCPCQPWSVAGKGQGADDPRDLWPTWFRIIAECGPATVFGEQTPSADGSFWLDRVYVDLESQDYAVAAADIPAAGIGAPMASQRYHFVATAGREQLSGKGYAPNARQAPAVERETREQRLRVDAQSAGRCPDMAETSSERTRRLPVRPGRPRQAEADTDRDGEVAGDELAEAHRGHGFWWSGPLQVGRNAIEAEVERGGRRHRAQWRIKPGLPLLADGIPGRVDLLRGFGNAIVPELAAEFIGAYMDLCVTSSGRQEEEHRWK